MSSEPRLSRISESSGLTVVAEASPPELADRSSVYSTTSSVDFQSATSHPPSPSSPVRGSDPLGRSLNPAEEVAAYLQPSNAASEEDKSSGEYLEHSTEHRDEDEEQTRGRSSSATERQHWTQTSPYRLEKVPASDFSLLTLEGKREGFSDEGHGGHRASEATTVEMCDSSYPPSQKDAGQGPDKAAREGFEYPDGGWRAWGNVVGAWLMLFATFGYTNAFGVYQSYYTVLFPTHTASDISWIGSVQLALFFSLAVVAGPLFDKGYFQWLIRVGSAIYLTSIFLIPQCTEYWHVLLVQGVMSGVGTGLVFLPSLSIISHFFLKRRSTVIGLATSGSSCGGVVFPILLNKLLDNRSIGFVDSVRITGYLIAACLVASNLIMSPNPQRRTTIKPAPPSLKSIFDLPYSATVAGAFLASFGLFFPNFYIQVYSAANGVSEELSFYTLAILNGASCLGRIVPNLVADYVGPMNIFGGSCGIAGVLIFTMFAATETVGIVVVTALYGFFSGAYISLVSPVIISLSRDLSEIGIRQGIGFIIVGLAALGGNPIAGRLLANTKSYDAPIVFSGVMVLAGSAFMLAGRHGQAKAKGTWKV